MAKTRALSYTEQRRRAQQAKQNLLPAAIAKAGQVGFTETAEKLAGKPNVTNPKKLGGRAGRERELICLTRFDT